MSNYKPVNYQVWDDRIKVGIVRLMNRRVAEVGAKFPLTREEVQRGVVEERALELLNELKVIYLMDSLPRYGTIWFTLPTTPEVPRQAVIQCACHKIDPLYMTADQLRPLNTFPRLSVSMFNLDHLSPEKRSELYNWVNLAVTEGRHCALVRGTVTTFLEKYADTLWHVMVRWPVLKLGFDDDTRERAQTAPRYPERYGWHGTIDADAARNWYLQNKEVMKFIDRLLLEASLLPAAREILPGLHASIQTWKKLGDEAY